MTIRNSLDAMSLANKLSVSSNQAGKSQRNIASGSRINRAADDAAGLAISMKMNAQIGGTGQAIRNVADGMSLLQTAEGALGSTQTMLGRMETLSLQASNGTLTDAERGFIQAEIDQIKSEINKVSGSTNFNNINLLDGSLSKENGGLTMQIGADDASENRLNVEMGAMNTNALGISGLNVMSADNALNAVGSVSNALNMVSEQRAYLGVTQNRLEHTANSLITASENLTASQSRIADADMATEMMEYMTQNILNQAQTAMLAHKINEPQGILQLLGQGAAVDIRA